MASEEKAREELLAEVAELRFRLEEAEETLRAIGSGEVDAFVVSGPDGEQVFTLKGAEQPYRVLVETMNQGAATLSGDGTILFGNERLAAMLQTPLERLIGTRLGSYVAAADRELFTACLDRRAAECDSEEISLLTGAGTPLPVLISCCAHDQGLSLVLTDLTPQKRNAEIVSSEKLARSIIEQAGEAIVVCDDGGTIIRASKLASTLFGENPLLRPFDELFRLRLAQGGDTFSVRTALSGTTVENVEVQFERGDSRSYQLILNAAPLQDTQGALIGCVLTLTDITQRRQAEEALKRINEALESRVAERTAELAASLERLRVQSAERLQAVEALREKEQMLLQQGRQAAMGEMIGNIAHQWRQPLNALGLVIQKLELDYEVGDFDRNSLSQSVHSSMELIQHMSRTIDDFRNFFKPGKDKAEFRAREAVANALALIGDGFDHEHIDIEVRTKHDAVIFGYRNEFAQVLLNIMNNARDVLTERGIDKPKVTIEISREQGRAAVTIADNAGGIPEEIIGKIFDPYFTTKGPQQGTGVGLFMSRTIIEKNMGGSLTVRNVAGGAEFRIEV